MENKHEPIELKIAPGGIAVLWMSHPPVNTLNQELRDALFSNLQSLEKDKNVQAIILAAKNNMFSAGADIKEFQSGFKGASLEDIQNALEQSKKITIAAIHKAALGGGLEIALACHYRVADPIATFTLPEVTLGIIPGAGGTQRLPRLIGIQKALEMIVSGRPLSAKKGKEYGLIDELFKDRLIENAIEFATKLLKKAKSAIRKTCDMNVKLKNQSVQSLEKGIQNEVNKIARKVGFIAPKSCVESVLNTIDLSFKDGIAHERDLFFKAVLSAESQALQHVFFSQRKACKPIDINYGNTASFHHVGIVGGGLMGGGIAMTVINAGIPVTLIETSEEKLEKSFANIKKNYEISVKNGRFTSKEVVERLSMINGSVDFGDLRYCDLVIEAVYEDIELKKAIFQKLNTVCAPNTILASNTSGLDINELAKEVDRKEKVLGLHFFSPANVTKLLEVVKTDKTSDHVINTVLAFAKAIKKNAVVVGVCPGFVGNRMIFKYVDRAYELALKGIKPHLVDEVIQGFGFPMGPFAMMDLTGLDLGWKNTLEADDLRDVMCMHDRLGQKNRKGFYDYKDHRKGVPSDEANQLIQEFARIKQIEPCQFDDSQVQTQLLLALINEGFKILEEGIVKRPSDIDVIYVYGYGWPAYKGGPMYYAQKLGLHKVLEQLSELKDKHGDFWTPAPLLEHLVETKMRLKDWVMDHSRN